MTLIDPSRGQVLAVNYVSEYYGKARIDDQGGVLQGGDNVRVVGIRDGQECCRWIVEPDGRVSAGWDPDRALDGWRAAMAADDPEDAEDGGSVRYIRPPEDAA